MLINLLIQSLMFFPLSLGIYISYRILKTTDLTADGSFVLGAVVYVKLLAASYSSFFSLCGAVTAGGLAGLGVSLIQRRDYISGLLAGILAVFSLASLNLIILEQPNVGIVGRETLIKMWGRIPTGFDPKINELLCLGCIFIALVFLVTWFFRTQVGLMLRGYGDHKNLLEKFGHSPEFYRTLGLVLSNALVAFCGVLTADISGYADVSMGIGIVLIGIGTVVIGEQIDTFLGKGERVGWITQMATLFFGVFAYFYFLSFFMHLGINPIHLKLAVSFALILFLYQTGKKKAEIL